MNKHTPIVELELDEETVSILKVSQVYNPEYLPVGILFTRGIPDRKSLNDWWKGRSIPASRFGIREALSIMNLSGTEHLLSKCFGLSLSDQYWINPQEQPLKWDDINFFENSFSDDVGNALFGFTPEHAGIDLFSPCNTSDGWLKKKWKIINGERVLIKSGSNPFRQEPINEVIATSIHKRLNCTNFVPYSLFWEDNMPYSICPNFVTPDKELVSAYSIINSMKKLNHHSFYEHLLLCCENLCIPGIKEFLDYLMVFDFIIANTDRHYNNFGCIRNVETLKWQGAAPIFDSGTSLWHDQVTKSILPDSDSSSQPFKPLHSQQILLAGSLDWVDFSVLSDLDEEFRTLLTASPYIDESRIDALCSGIKGRIHQLEQLALS